MRKELWAIFAALKADNETQVVVLTGQGTHFSYGTFDPAPRGATDKDTIVRMDLAGNMLIDDLENLPQITIAVALCPSRRQEETRVGQQGVGTDRSRWAPKHKPKKNL